MATEFESLMSKMDMGFEKVFTKVDRLRQDFSDHKLICSDKFAILDKELTVRNAVGCLEQRQEADKKDWGRWFVRLTMGATALGAIAFIWKLLTGGLRIVAG